MQSLGFSSLSQELGLARSKWWGKVYSLWSGSSEEKSRSMHREAHQSRNHNADGPLPQRRVSLCTIPDFLMRFLKILTRQ